MQRAWPDPSISIQRELESCFACVCVFCMWIDLFLMFPLKLRFFSCLTASGSVSPLSIGIQGFYRSSPELDSQGGYQQLMIRWLVTDFEASVFVLWYREQHDTLFPCSRSIFIQYLLKL